MLNQYVLLKKALGFAKVSNIQIKLIFSHDKQFRKSGETVFVRFSDLSSRTLPFAILFWRYLWKSVPKKHPKS